MPESMINPYRIILRYILYWIENIDKTAKIKPFNPINPNFELN